MAALYLEKKLKIQQFDPRNQVSEWSWWDLKGLIEAWCGHEEWLCCRQDTARAQLKATSVTEKCELRVVRHSGSPPPHTHTSPKIEFSQVGSKIKHHVNSPCQILPECHSATSGRDKFMRILIKIFLIFSIKISLT